jgi:hypothetical protein
LPPRLREFTRRLVNLDDDEEIAADMQKKIGRIYQLKSEVKKMLLECMGQSHEIVNA